MQAKGWMMFNVFVNKYHQGAKEALLKGLADEETRQAIDHDINSHDISPTVVKSWDLIKKIHYSWMKEPLQLLPQELQALILSALPQEQSEGLASLLRMQVTPPQFSDIIGRFLVDLFYRRYVASEELPPQLLPQTKLSFLINFNKNQLIELFDYLGLYDLSQDVRCIVDKVRLKKIFLSLSQNMQEFLKICLQQRDWLPPQPLPLDTWDGQKKTLIRLIHRRGIDRLGKALSAHPEPLIHHLSHVLDTGRGTILKKCVSKEVPPDIVPFLEGQVINVVKFISRSSRE